MKICILCAGSLGCAIGGVLTEAGHGVWLINRNADQVEAMNRRGLILRDQGIDRTVAVRAATLAQDAGMVALVIVLVKSFHTGQAMQAAMSLIGPDTVVLSLQNGVGHVNIGTKGKDTHIGELDGRMTERVQRIAALFNAAGLLTLVSGIRLSITEPNHACRFTCCAAPRGGRALLGAARWERLHNVCLKHP